MVAEQFTELQKAVGAEITKTDLVPAFQVKSNIQTCNRYLSSFTLYSESCKNTMMNTHPNFENIRQTRNLGPWFLDTERMTSLGEILPFGTDVLTLK
jgi:hypothetical protein